MSKQKKVPQKKQEINRFELIEAALLKKTKADLIELLMDTAREHDEVYRSLESKLNIEKPTDLLLADLLLADVVSAMDRATDFDERRDRSVSQASDSCGQSW